MSFSFTTKADDKTQLVANISQELATVVEGQPIHAKDRQAVQDAAEDLIDLIVDPSEGEQVTAHVSGSLGWRGENQEVTSASVNISVNTSAK